MDKPLWQTTLWQLSFELALHYIEYNPKSEMYIAEIKKEIQSREKEEKK